MGQYFCQSLGALKCYRVDDASCDQEAGLKPVVVDGKEKEEQPKSEISSDRCALYQHHFKWFQFACIRIWKNDVNIYLSIF